MRQLLVSIALLGPVAALPLEPASSVVLASPGSAKGQLRTEATEHDLYATYRLSDAFTHDMREELGSGLPLEFTHFIEVARRRSLWFDRILVRRSVTTRALYDTLTRQYTLTRQVDGETAQTSMALTEEEMVGWMTAIDRLRLADPAALMEGSGDNLYVRVRTRLRRRLLLMFIPWDLETSWERVALPPPQESAGRGR